jgi:hypothetical protein
VASLAAAATLLSRAALFLRSFRPTTSGISPLISSSTRREAKGGFEVGLDLILEELKAP